jgi:hypothetical protein
MAKNFHTAQKLLSAAILCVFFLNGGAAAQNNPLACRATIALPDAASADGGEIRFAAVGDTGRGNTSQRLIAQALEEIQSKTGFKLLLLLGDNVYKKGRLADFEVKLYAPYRKLKDQRGVTIRGAIGNHDIEGEDLNGVSAQQSYFGMCGAAGVGCDATYYSFTVGNVDFFALDSNLLVNYKPDFTARYTTKTRQDQLNWLAGELPKSAAKNNWQIVFMHHIFYASSSGHGIYSDSSEDLIDMIELRETIPLLNASKVDLALSGHDHFYEKINAQKAPTPGDFIYFVSGAGAKKDGSLRTSDFQVCGNDEELSFMLFSVKADTLTYWAINAQGAAFDSGTIRRK